MAIFGYSVIDSICRTALLSYGSLLFSFVIGLAPLLLSSAPAWSRLEHAVDWLRLAALQVVALAALLQRRHNAGMLVLLLVQAVCLHRVASCGGRDNGVSLLARVVLFEWFGWAALFQFGNTNSTATIDISGAYTGLSSYNPALVGALTWFILYTGPLLYAVAALASTLRAHAPRRDAELTTLTTAATTTALIGAVAERALLTAGTTQAAVGALYAGVFSLVCVLLRHHLFVWSVVSPKYVYVVGAASLLAVKLLLAALLAFATRARTRVKAKQ